jgi:hypothetical protein
MIAAVFDDACPVQFAGRVGRTHSTNPEHVRDQFLGHMQFIAPQLIRRKQQPATPLLFYTNGGGCRPRTATSA